MSEVQTATLADFLLARFAEDEQNINDDDWASGDGGLHIITTSMRHRLLAECEAKRRIVELIGVDSRAVYTPFAWEILQHLATPYADHPDYRPEWRP